MQKPRPCRPAHRPASSGAGAILATLIAAVGLFATAQPAAAQPVVADKDMEELRQRAPAGENDAATIRQWLATEFAAISPQTAGRFRQQIQKLRTHATTNPAFRTEFNLRLAEFAKKQLAAEAPEPAAEELIRTLIDIDDPAVQPGFEGGLASTYPTIRYLAAKGLAGLTQRIVADPNKVAPYVKVLQGAGVAETSPIVVERIYRALDIANIGPEALTAYERIFAARVDRYRKGHTRLLDNAETTAIQILAAADLDQAQAAPIVRVLVPLLRLDVEQLLSMLDNPLIPQPPGARDLLERRICVNEEFLTRATRPPVSLRGKICDQLEHEEPGMAAAVALELNTWIGTPQTEGALNKAPWNVPVGAP